MVDLGGGTGSFLIPIIERYSSLKCTLFELPTTAEVARRRLSAHPLGGKIEILEGDLFKDVIPKGFDCFLLANVIHLFTPEHNLDLLQRIRKSADTNSKLLLVDFWTDPTHTQPPMAAILAGEFQTVTGEGDVYSVNEVKEWLSTSDWRFNGTRNLTGPASLIIADA